MGCLTCSEKASMVADAQAKVTEAQNTVNEYQQALSDLNREQSLTNECKSDNQRASTAIKETGTIAGASLDPNGLLDADAQCLEEYSDALSQSISQCETGLSQAQQQLQSAQQELERVNSLSCSDTCDAEDL